MESETEPGDSTFVHLTNSQDQSIFNEYLVPSGFSTHAGAVSHNLNIENVLETSTLDQVPGNIVLQDPAHNATYASSIKMPDISLLVPTTNEIPGKTNIQSIPEQIENIENDELIKKLFANPKWYFDKCTNITEEQQNAMDQCIINEILQPKESRVSIDAASQSLGHVMGPDQTVGQSDLQVLFFDQTPGKNMQLVSTLDQTPGKNMQLVSTLDQTPDKNMQLVSTLDQTPGKNMQLVSTLGQAPGKNVPQDAILDQAPFKNVQQVSTLDQAPGKNVHYVPTLNQTQGNNTLLAHDTTYISSSAQTPDKMPDTITPHVPAVSQISGKTLQKNSVKTQTLTQSQGKQGSVSVAYILEGEKKKFEIQVDSHEPTTHIYLSHDKTSGDMCVSKDSLQRCLKRNCNIVSTSDTLVMPKKQKLHEVREPFTDPTREHGRQRAIYQHQYRESKKKESKDNIKEIAQERARREDVEEQLVIMTCDRDQKAAIIEQLQKQLKEATEDKNKIVKLMYLLMKNLELKKI